jgi:membrane protein
MFVRYYEDDLSGRAAQLAYFFLLSLFPFIIFLLTLVAYLPIEVENILALVGNYAPRDTMLFINQNIINLLENKNGQLLSLGLLGTLFAASNGINALVKTMNRSYGIKETRPFIIARLISVVLTVAMFAVVLVALLLPVFGRLIGNYLFSFFGLSYSFLDFWATARWVVSFIVFLLVLLFLYKIAPEKKVSFMEAFPGALFATVGWQGASLLFAFYVERFGKFSATYGSLGVVIVLMIWLYLSALVIIIGGELNALLYKMKKEQ